VLVITVRPRPRCWSTVSGDVVLADIVITVIAVTGMYLSFSHNIIKERSLLLI